MLKIREFRSEIAPLIQIIFRKIFDIREGEGKRAGLMFLYIFLEISTLLVIKPVSFGLFLSRFGADQLPYVFILVSIFALIISGFYSRRLKKESLENLIINTLRLATVSMIFFWLMLTFNIQRDIILYIFYVWVAIFAVVTTSQFWVLANVIFNVREAKRLIGFIGSGAIAGGIFGGYLTKVFAPVIGSENLIIIGVISIGACIPITRSIWKENSSENGSEILIRQKQVVNPAIHPFKIIKKSSHLTYLASLVGISVLVAKLVEFQFSAIASMNIEQEDQLTAFFGFWLSNLNIISLVIQLLLTRRIVGVFGVGTSLFFLPLGILSGSFIILLTPALWAAVLIKIIDGSLKQSINKAGMELLALPISVAIKNQAKSFIDVVVDSVATGFGGILLLILTLVLNASVSQISFLVIILIAIWLYLVRRVKSEYLQSIRLKIEGTGLENQAEAIDLQNESVFGGLAKILKSNNQAQILPALKMIKDVQSERLIPFLSDLLKHSSRDIRLETLRILYYYKQNYHSEIEAMIHDPDHEIKTEAFHYFFQHNIEDRVKILDQYLENSDYRIRTAALICVARESRDNQSLRNIFNIRGRIENEIRESRKSSDKEEVIFRMSACAKAIGAAHIKELYPYLHIFLNEKALPLLRATITSAGQTHVAEFMPILIHLLSKKSLLKYTAQALASYQPEIVPILEEQISNKSIPLSIRNNIPTVLFVIATQRSADILLASLKDKNPEIRFNISSALYKLRIQNPDIRFDERLIVKFILDETQSYMQIWSVMQSQTLFNKKSDHENTEIVKAGKKLIKDLERRLDLNLERIFRLLGLKYPPKDINTVYSSIKSNKDDLRINALEFLDNLLDIDLKRVIIPIIETTIIGTVIDEALDRIGLKIPSTRECMIMLLSGEDVILKLGALNLIMQTGDDQYLSVIGQLVNSWDPRIRRMARKTLQKLNFTV